MAGLSTPLHLAASLLALFAASGLAIVVLVAGRMTLPIGTPREGSRWPRERQRGGRRLAAGEVLVTVGAVSYALGHTLSGALVDADGEVVGWLRAGGLVAIALGLAPRELAALAGQVIIIPIVPRATALVGSAAGALAGLHAAVGGRRTLLVAFGLVAWGAAEGLTQVSATASAWASVAGSLGIGGYLWAASARRLLAKFVTAVVASLLAVVVLMAGVLSGFGSQALVDEELRRLEAASAQLVEQVEQEWPAAAVVAARPLQGSGDTLLALEAGNQAQLAQVYSLLSSQDFYAVLASDGRALNTYDPGGELGQSFFLSVSGSALVSQLVGGAVQEGSDLASIGGRLVALGGVRLPRDDARAEDPPLGLLVTGRIAGDRWAAQMSQERLFDVLGEVGGEVSVASAGLVGITPQVAGAIGTGADSAVLDAGGETLYAAATVVRDPTSREPLGRITAVSSADVIVSLERAQGRQLFLLALVGAALAGFVAALVTGRLVAPIRRLTAAAAAVREGDLGAQAAVRSGDEVGDLGRTFNEMTTSLAAQSAQLRDAADVQAQLRARLEALTSSMSDALVAVNTDGKVIAFNPAAERLTGRDVTDVEGLPLEEVLVGHGPGDAAPVAVVGHALSERVIAVQLLLARPDGRLVPTAATAAPVRDEHGEVFGRVLVLRDVTREAEVERMKTEFLSNVSHELRTPLTPIKGYAEVLARRDVGPEATRQFAAEILSSTDRLERIVGMIVDFAALDSGRLELEPCPVVLAELVGDAVARWRAQHPGREFRRRVARSLPAVTADPAMLRRALDELLDNAVKFSPGGEPISVSATSEVRPNGRSVVRLSVRDRGVGIERETAAGVFADFYQVDASETRHYGGLGLGLALVRRIVEGVGGVAEVESEIGAGSTVHMLLPAADPAAESTLPPGAAPAYP